MSDRLRLAIFGCGAITCDYHLPAAVAHPDVRVAALVDSNVNRAQDLGRLYGLDCKFTADYKSVLGEVDALINALPNSLHTPVNLEAFHAGVHVLCEKPLAITAADARTCCEVAERSGLVLAIGMQRRFHANHRLLRLALDEGMLGPLQGYDWEDGTSWDWGTKSGFYFSRAEAGGGVLMDYGVHLLDSVVDWFGPVSRFEYQDDNWGGGIEANVILALQHNGPYGNLSGRIRLSRTYNLKNRLSVWGEAARFEMPRGELDSLVLFRRISEQEVSMTLRFSNGQESEAASPYYAQLDNFVASIHGRQRPLADGRQALAIIQLIEECYAKARRIAEPWVEIGEAASKASA